jgi:hypothetical protein
VDDGVEPPVLPLELQPLAGQEERDAQVVGGHGLLEEAVDLGLVQGLDGQLGGDVPGHHHPHRVRVAVPHDPEELEAVRSGHPVVGEHDVDGLAAQDPEGGAGVCGGEDPVLLAQGEGEPLDEAGVVVDNEENGSAHGRSWRGVWNRCSRRHPGFPVESRR